MARRNFIIGTLFIIVKFTLDLNQATIMQTPLVWRCGPDKHKDPRVWL